MPSEDKRRLIVEDAAEVLAVGEHLRPLRQVRAAGVDQIDAGQPVLARDLLRAQVLLHGYGIVGAALDGGVVAHDDAFAPLDAADARDDAGAVDRVLVHAVGGERRQFEERRARIDQPQHPFSWKKLSARRMSLARTRRPAQRCFGALLRKLLRQRAHLRRVGAELWSPACRSSRRVSPPGPPRFGFARPHYGAARERRECAFMEHHILARFETLSEHAARVALNPRRKGPGRSQIPRRGTMKRTLLVSVAAVALAAGSTVALSQGTGGGAGGAPSAPDGQSVRPVGRTGHAGRQGSAGRAGARIRREAAEVDPAVPGPGSGRRTGHDHPAVAGRQERPGSDPSNPGEERPAIDPAADAGPAAGAAASAATDRIARARRLQAGNRDAVDDPRWRQRLVHRRAEDHDPPDRADQLGAARDQRQLRRQGRHRGAAHRARRAPPA